MNKSFTLPKIISPFYSGKKDKRIPRRLKKKVKTWCDIHWDSLTNAQRLWDYLGCSNNKYKWHVILAVTN